MKLFAFVKREPKRATWAIIIVSIAFLTTFSALIAFGAISVYARTSARKASVSLVATDVLALRDAYQTADSENALVLRTQIEIRSNDCLSRADKERLSGMLAEADGRFFALCEEIEKAASKQRWTAQMLTEAIRVAEKAGTGSLALAAHTAERAGNSVSVYTPPALGKTPLLIAKNYFSVSRIFHPAEDGVYCENLYARFHLPTRQMISYAIECTPGIAMWSKEACAEKAKYYLRTEIGLKDCAVNASESRDGICWVMLSSDRGEAAKIGVRMDTGAVCYFQMLYED